MTDTDLANQLRDEGLYCQNIFEDIFQYEDIPTSTVRLNASTIKQLFKDTKYNLKDVRKSKLVKPVNFNFFQMK